MAGGAMADAFDPYQSWLEIPLSRRPPSNYDLVGVEEGETDLDRIREAAAARIEEIRKLTLGPQREHAFRLLDEISEALVSLLKGREADAAETKEPPILAELVTQPKRPVTPEAISPFAEDGRADTADTKGIPPPVESALRPERPPWPPQPGIEPIADVPRHGGRAPRPTRALVLAPVFLVDRLLRYVAGEGNDILHGFLRFMAVVVVVVSALGLPWAIRTGIQRALDSQGLTASRVPRGDRQSAEDRSSEPREGDEEWPDSPDPGDPPGFDPEGISDVSPKEHPGSGEDLLLGTTPGPVMPGKPWAWGSNNTGQLGGGTTTATPTPAQVRGLDGVVALASNFIWEREDLHHSLALKSDGTVWAWGWNGFGQLGDGTTTQRLVPVRVEGLTDVVAVAARGHHSMALKSDGTAWTWGHNRHGELGDGTTADRHIPVQATSLSRVIAIAAGDWFSLALTEDGTVWSWGGDPGQTGTRTTPGAVTGLTDVAAIEAAGGHCLALKRDGAVWAWGDNDTGKLGDGMTGWQHAPVQVKGPRGSGHLAGVQAIAVGRYHSMAVKVDGTVWAWGGNGSGQLGDGSNMQHLTAVQVSGLPQVTAITAGRQHSLALAGDGDLWAWGCNRHGQLGDGTNTDRLSPVRIASLTSPVSSIAAGTFSSFAVVPPAVAASTPVGPTNTDAVRPSSKPTPRDAVGPFSTITNSIGMKLVLIPAGEFLMGSPDSDEEASDGEKPQHLVQITKPFYLGVYEVTQGEYERVLSESPSAFSRTGGLKDEVAGKDTNRLPAEEISWEDAMEFCRKLSAMSEEKAAGQVYRLPTEAEWEYACRAGSTTKRCFGDSESQLGQYAWYDNNSGGSTHPVGRKKPNVWGLYDMHGNMNEWCADWYDKHTPAFALIVGHPAARFKRAVRRHFVHVGSVC